MASKEANQQFVNVILQAVKANTELQLHCEKHGEVMAFDAGNGNLYCPQCYNTSLGKIEDATFKEHVDKIYDLKRKNYSISGAKKGTAGKVKLK